MGLGDEMTDRELLELAAKAAGHARLSVHWNPLVDYGEALMLAEKLGLCIDMSGSDTWAGQYPIEQGNNGAVDADVRRAIVLVAAEIGSEHDHRRHHPHGAGGWAF